MTSSSAQDLARWTNALALSAFWSKMQRFAELDFQMSVVVEIKLYQGTLTKLTPLSMTKQKQNIAHAIPQTATQLMQSQLQTYCYIEDHVVHVPTNKIIKFM